MSFHSQWHLPLSLPCPRAGEARLVQRAGRGIKGTAIELRQFAKFLILILILLLIFKLQEITIMMKSKIKRRKVAKHLLNSMAVPPDLPRRGRGTGQTAPLPSLEGLGVGSWS